jgi:hypothetical protein
VGRPTRGKGTEFALPETDQFSTDAVNRLGFLGQQLFKPLGDPAIPQESKHRRMLDQRREELASGIV